MNQVSSRGCSRAYILCVLLRGLHYVRNLRVKSQPVSFPFPAFEIECWLEKAKEDCSDVEFQRMYGGTDFSPSDVSTFWTSASHFYTWWVRLTQRRMFVWCVMLTLDTNYKVEEQHWKENQVSQSAEGFDLRWRWWKECHQVTDSFAFSLIRWCVPVIYSQ